MVVLCEITERGLKRVIIKDFSSVLNPGDKAVLCISHNETLIERTASVVIHLEQLKRKTESRYCVAKTSYRQYAAYQRFFRKQGGYPRFKSRRHSRMSYTTNYTNGNIAVLAGEVKLPKLGKVRAVIHRRAPEDWRLKQQKKIACVAKKAANQRKDFLHKKSTEIANRYDLVCVEDLSLRALANRGFGNGKATMDNGYGSFLTMLKYKLEERGKRLIRIDKWYASTKICSHCGAVKMMPLSVRTV